MYSQTLSQLLDTFIAELLAQKKCDVDSGSKKMRVVITGNDISALTETVNCLVALGRAGYQLWVTFSQSASLSALKMSYIQAIGQRCSGVVFDEQPRHDVVFDDDYESLFLPALSTNSMSKIALGIRDNIASEWVFHAFSQQKQIIATLNSECLAGPKNAVLPQPLLSRLSSYVQTLEQYGIVFSGNKMMCSARSDATPTGARQLAVDAVHNKVPHAPKRLITLRDIRLHPTNEHLCVDSKTLITPAARDEISHRKITVIQGQ
ncbi:hypothetical protein SJI19_06575 [Acerihabitans sp. TG2]|uniref:hypothetical protein n=1 Tax=Acerihabitans sp. TG2 TaxID=3096008 RepID=UPI002B224D7E|nr:hypothetical protein [Acerihabitans sp. TG2]MEA9390216.1 hypothetical protein [Acerihabitans sp. TG2]